MIGREKNGEFLLRFIYYWVASLRIELRQSSQIELNPHAESSTHRFTVTIVKMLFINIYIILL